LISAVTPRAHFAARREHPARKKEMDQPLYTGMSDQETKILISTGRAPFSALSEAVKHLQFSFGVDVETHNHHIFRRMSDINELFLVTDWRIETKIRSTGDEANQARLGTSSQFGT
jgi:hypothetical protein